MGLRSTCTCRRLHCLHIVRKIVNRQCSDGRTRLRCEDRVASTRHAWDRIPRSCLRNWKRTSLCTARPTAVVPSPTWQGRVESGPFRKTRRMSKSSSCKINLPLRQAPNNVPFSIVHGMFSLFNTLSRRKTANFMRASPYLSMPEMGLLKLLLSAISVLNWTKGNNMHVDAFSHKILVTYLPRL